MSRVRSRGEGSIAKRKDGRYEIRLSRGSVNGQRQRVFLYARTRADAVQLLGQARADQKPGRPGAAGTGETVEHFLARWIEDHVAKTKRIGTVASYEQNVRTYINPVIGKVRLAELTREHVEAVQNNASAHGLNPSTVRLIRVVLGSALKRAEMWEVPGARNVVRLTDGPKVKPHKPQFLDKDQARAFLRATTGKRWEVLWMVALYCGLRLGELQALRWQDVDLDRRQLRVVNTYKTPSRGLEDVKTASSSAVVDLPESVAAALKALRVRQMQEQGAAQHEGMPWLNQWGLVFTGDYGYPTGRTALVREFHRILREAGLPLMRIHDLRHTSGSLDLAAGVPLKLIQEKLRHARLATTADIYTHVTPVARREAADALERLLS